MFAHRLEGNALRRLRDAKNLAGVVVGEKPPGDNDKQCQGRHKHGQRHVERREPMAHDRLQTAVVGIAHAVEESLEGVVERAVFFPVLRVDEPAAHHRRQRQRNEPGHQHRDKQWSRQIRAAAAPAGRP